MSLQEHSEFINDVKQPLRKDKKGETDANIVVTLSILCIVSRLSLSALP